MGFNSGFKGLNIFDPHINAVKIHDICSCPSDHPVACRKEYLQHVILRFSLWASKLFNWKNWFRLRKDSHFILTRLHKERNVRAITLIVTNKILNTTWMAEIRSHEGYIVASIAAVIAGLKITAYTLQRVSPGLLVIRIITLIWNLCNCAVSKQNQTAGNGRRLVNKEITKEYSW